jgi:hypothetical protein
MEQVIGDRESLQDLHYRTGAETINHNICPFNQFCDNIRSPWILQVDRQAVPIRHNKRKGIAAV